VHWSRIDDVLNRAGDLSGKVIVACARYTEPLALLVGHLAYDGREGPEMAYRFEQF